MTDNEVNKIIAEFMGWKKSKSSLGGYDKGSYVAQLLGITPLNYTKSLDALVPVWEKLYKAESKYDTLKIDICDMHPSTSFIVWHRDMFLDGSVKHFEESTTIQKAAAYATVKAILELKND